MHISRVSVAEQGSLATLGQLAQPVNELYYSGDFLALLNKPLISVVGSRKYSSYGATVTTKLVSGLARAGIVIVSGLALGIDSIAHKAALEAGGKTIAVIPSGLDHVYPASHRSLANRIVDDGGALVSEYDNGRGSPTKYQFIARNRIIAALSRGVLITEAAAKSGSLHTANFALEQGTEVFAVPGNITSITSEGTNNLIKMGASPVTSAEDILQLLQLTFDTAAYTPQNQTEAQILHELHRRPSATSELLHNTGLHITELHQTLTLLEIRQVIQSNTSGAWHIL